MGSFSPVHLIILFLIFLVFGYPVWRILKRLGLNPFLSLICLIPIGNLIGLWVLAYARWPNIDETASKG
jgi:hypothetical protein